MKLRIHQPERATSRIRAWAVAAWLCSAGLLPLAVTAGPLQHPPGIAAQGGHGAQDIRDIRPPYEIAQSWLWLGGLGAAAVLGAAGLVLWRRRRGVAESKSFHEQVLERLAATRVLMQNGDARGFSIAVSDILRDYVERQFAIRAAHRTTVEFLREYLQQAQSPLQRYEGALAQFLSCCDLAKFARWGLSTAQMEEMLESARIFVEQTRRVPAADPGDTPAYAH